MIGVQGVKNSPISPSQDGWPALLGFLIFLLLTDLLIFNRRAHVATFVSNSSNFLWVGLGLSMTFVIGAMFNRAAAMEYISGYLIEESEHRQCVCVVTNFRPFSGSPTISAPDTLLKFWCLVMRFIFISSVSWLSSV